MRALAWSVFVVLVLPAGPIQAQDQAASLFTPNWQFTDDQGKSTTLGQLAGDHVVVTMGYVACVARCPHTIDRLKEVSAAAARHGEPLQIIFVTLDPLRDTPRRLHDYRVRRGLSGSTWHLLTADKKTTAALAQALGIRAAYDDPHIDHDVKVVALDREGSPVRSVTGWRFDEHDLLGH